MTQKRFFARWTDRQDGQDLYDVLDSETMTRTLERQPYHVANDYARKLNNEPEAQGEWALAFKPEQLQWTPEEIARAKAERAAPYAPNRIKAFMAPVPMVSPEDLERFAEEWKHARPGAIVWTPHFDPMTIAPIYEDDAEPE